MPHLLLECTRNLIEEFDSRQLFSALHSEMMDTGEFVLDEIKSRMMVIQQFPAKF